MWKRVLTTALFAAFSGTSAHSLTLLDETFDDLDYDNWFIETTVDGKNSNFVVSATDQPVNTYQRDVLDQNGHHKPTTETSAPLISSADVSGDGNQSPSLLLRTGRKNLEPNAPHEGVILKHRFYVSQLMTVDVSVDVMAMPYVPYYINLTGGLFKLSINGMLLDSWEATPIGISTTAYLNNRAQTGALRETLKGSIELTNGDHFVELFVGRNMLTGLGTPAQYIDNVRVAATTPANVPLPGGMALLLSAAACLALTRATRRRSAMGSRRPDA